MNAESFPGAESLVGVCSVTPKPDPERNEDHGTAIHVPGALRGVAVADGLGSYSQARQAARNAVVGVAAWLRRTPEAAPDRLRQLFADIHHALRECGRTSAGGADPEAQTFGTTLIVALETSTELVAAYAGNGAIWHIRGNFDDFPASTALPWSAVNYLSPHSVLRDGREVLYRILDAAAEHPPVPAVVRVEKDADFGDIFLVCTDGIYSADQLTQGTDADGKLWLSGEATMVEFYRALRQLFAGWSGEGEPALEHALQGYLTELRGRGMLEDDATVGVIVTARALEYQRRKRAPRAAQPPATGPDADCETPDSAPPAEGDSAKSGGGGAGEAGVDRPLDSPSTLDRNGGGESEADETVTAQRM